MLLSAAQELTKENGPQREKTFVHNR